MESSQNKTRLARPTLKEKSLLHSVLVQRAPPANTPGLYSHLLRYWRWGLLERSLNSMGLLYRVSASGNERLAWLRKQAGG